MPTTRYATIGLVVLAFVSAAVAVRVAHGLVHRLLDALEIVGAQNRAAVQKRARQLIRALTLLAFGVAALASLSLALGRFGVNEPQWGSAAVRTLVPHARGQPHHHRRRRLRHHARREPGD
jgi:hypothetical protein